MQGSLCIPKYCSTLVCDLRHGAVDVPLSPIKRHCYTESSLRLQNGVLIRSQTVSQLMKQKYESYKKSGGENQAEKTATTYQLA